MSYWVSDSIDAQSVAAPLTGSAIFLVVTVNADDDSLAKSRDVIGSVDDLLKNVSFRDRLARLSCIVGIGSKLWDRLDIGKKPKELKPFEPIEGNPHKAPSTPGDVLFHIRSERQDICFEFERILLQKLGSSVTVVDEVVGFRYFDARDLLGFVDGTANPVGQDIGGAALVGDEDAEFKGGSYVVIQKYLHNLDAWNATSTSVQEEIIGRTKSDNIELPDDYVPRKSHKTLTTITDKDGNEHDILRDNMPFGRPGAGEFGTYFIGYSRALCVTESMLRNMFIGDPPGSYDRILDFSTAHTGVTFFAPPRRVLESLADD